MKTLVLIDLSTSIVHTELGERLVRVMRALFDAEKGVKHEMIIRGVTDGSQAYFLDEWPLDQPFDQSFVQYMKKNFNPINEDCTAKGVLQAFQASHNNDIMNVFFITDGFVDGNMLEVMSFIIEQDVRFHTLCLTARSKAHSYTYDDLPPHTTCYLQDTYKNEQELLEEVWGDGNMAGIVDVIELNASPAPEKEKDWADEGYELTDNGSSIQKIVAEQVIQDDTCNLRFIVYHVGNTQDYSIFPDGSWHEMEIVSQPNTSMAITTRIRVYVTQDMMDNLQKFVTKAATALG